MKKTIICALLAGMLTASAYAQEVNTGVNFETRDITLSGTFESAAINRMISIEVKKKDDSSVVPYIGMIVSEADGSYNFKFRMPEDAETGYYDITLGVYGEEPTVKEVYFAQKADIDTLLNTINTAENHSAIRTEIEKNVDVLNIPKVWYDKLDDVGKDAVAKALMNGRSYETLSEANAVAYKEMAVQIFRCAGNSDAILEAMNNFAEVYNINAETSKCFNIYQKFGEESKLEENQAYARTLMAAIDCNDVDGIISAYDTATLLAAVSRAKDPAEIKGYLDDASYRSVITFDLGKYDKSNKEKTAQYLYGLGDFDSMSALESAISTAYANQNSSDGGNGGGGGNGTSSGKNNGSSSGGITNYAPGTTVPDNKNDKPDDKKTFIDLADAAWAENAVLYLAEKNVVAGTETADGEYKFEPNSLVTREQFVKMLVQAFNLNDSEAVCEFDDMADGHWAYSAVASAYKNGIVSGISENNFGTGMNISRQDMAVMAYKAAKAAGYELESSEDLSFADKDSIAEYARESVGAMSANGIINGYPDGSFAPAETATRAQAAQIIYTIIK